MVGGGSLRAKVGVALAAAFVGSLTWASESTRSLDMQGHRGARGLAPENTLAGFARALEIGVTTLELDVGLTRDGVVVASHDRRLNPAITRDAAGRWLELPTPALRELDFEAVRAYDVGRIRPGTRYAKRFPHQRPRDGERIPTLSKVVDLVRRAGNGSVRLSVETKLSPEAPGDTASAEVLARDLVVALRDEGFASRSTVQSFDWRTLGRVRAMAPEIPTVHLTVEQDWLDNVRRGQPGPSPWLDGHDVDEHGGSLPRLVAAAGGAIWSPYHREVDAAAVVEAHGFGLRVVVWTVNEPERMRALIAMGVDGIVTDYPDRLRAVARFVGFELPPATPVSP